MLLLPLSPIEAQAVLWWARLDRLTSGTPDPALQQLADRVRDAVHAELLAGGLHGSMHGALSDVSQADVLQAGRPGQRADRAVRLRRMRLLRGLPTSGVPMSKPQGKPFVFPIRTDYDRLRGVTKMVRSANPAGAADRRMTKSRGAALSVSRRESSSGR